jgi:protein-S-isoprenylcysteine O-methyltransferase Ste14
MKNTKDSPGVFIPPPLIYAAFFLLSFLLQGYFTIKRAFFFHSIAANIIGIIIIIFGQIVFGIPALRQFFKTKNTVVLIKPANSLQTTGIYSYSRNPMYVGLLFTYLGMAFIFGNWWTLILLPLLIVLITNRVILPEERYLTRAFGDEYADYKIKVRRWI